jgi:hypothetical protein
MPFLTPLRTEQTGPNRWRLIEPFVYQTKSGAFTTSIAVPAGFETDFATVPRIPVAGLVAGGAGEKAAVVHDWLYHTKPCSRKETDQMFLDALTEEGEPWWRRYIMYAAVRAFGGPFWRN